MIALENAHFLLDLVNSQQIPASHPRLTEMAELVTSTRRELEAFIGASEASSDIPA
jgi:hypothetical protein